ncbi:MAG: T9SS type A sorting domain-containing protein [Candidatus Kapaibacteriota bacterium]
MNQRLILAAALLFVCATITLRAASTPSANRNTVNAILGDISFVKTFGKAPTEATNERLRIQTHLEYVENLLRKADVAHLSTPLRERRARMLALLLEYRLAGAFPVNCDFPHERRPCFIDAAGNICAVGYLIEQTAGRALAERITAAHKYDVLADMAMPELTAWVAASGLTARECGMIQPSYRPPILANNAFSVTITNANRFVENAVPDTIHARFLGLPRYLTFPHEGFLSLSIENLGNYKESTRFWAAQAVGTVVTTATGEIWDMQVSFPLRASFSLSSFTAATYRVLGIWHDRFLSGDTYFSIATTLTVSPATSTRDLTLPSPITLSPNPAHESIMLALPENELHRVRVMNTLGSQMSALSDAAGATALDVSGLAAGVYFVEVESQKTRRRTMQKVVKY